MIPNPFRSRIAHLTAIDTNRRNPAAAVLDGNATVDVTDREDRVATAIHLVVSEAISRNDPAAWNAAWDVLAHAATAGLEDMSVRAARMLFEARPAGAPIPHQVKAFTPLLKRTGLIADAPSGN